MKIPPNLEILNKQRDRKGEKERELRGREKANSEICFTLQDGNNNPVYETAKETLMYRTVFWTLWKRERVR